MVPAYSTIKDINERVWFFFFFSPLKSRIFFSSLHFANFNGMTHSSSSCFFSGKRTWASCLSESTRTGECQRVPYLIRSRSTPVLMTSCFRFVFWFFFFHLDSRLEGWISLPTKNTKRFGWDRKVNTQPLFLFYFIVFTFSKSPPLLWPEIVFVFSVFCSMWWLAVKRYCSITVSRTESWPTPSWPWTSSECFTTSLTKIVIMTSF